MQSIEDRSLVKVPCPLCGSEEARLVFEVKDYSFQCTSQVFGVQRCISCGCGYLSPRPKAEEMANYYPKEYYWSWEGEDKPVAWTELISKRRLQLENKASWLAELSPGRLLDIGAQKGEFLWYMLQRGWHVEGIEMDGSVPNPAGMAIRYGDFLKMDLPRESYDCITLWAVLEHVYQPAAYMKKVAELLRPGGRVVVLVTNFNSIQGRFFRADDYPRHLTLFTIGSVKRLCDKHGLEIEKYCTNQDLFGGSLSGGLLYLVKRMAGYTGEELWGEWKQLEDPDLFWVKFRGQPSKAVRLASWMDRVITMPLERVLDRIGYGFNLVFSAKKR